MQTPRLNLVSGLIPIFFSSIGAMLISGCATIPEGATAEKTKPESGVDFAAQVKPILEERCVMCHNRATLPDRTSFETGKLALKGDAHGPVLIPGDANGSRLMAAISSPDFHENAMPPVSLRVSADEKAVLRRWINEGAYWPEGEDGRLEPDHIPLE